MDSDLYTIGLWLKGYPTPDDALKAAKTTPIAELYRKGRRRIKTMVIAAKAVHNILLDNLFVTPNTTYRATVVDGLTAFFSKYYPDYAANEIIITADYPVCNSLQKFAGIEFIRAYLASIYYENQFCQMFDSVRVHYLLSGYAKNYDKLILNIYEPVLTAALGCVLTQAPVEQLNITENGRDYLQNLFASMPQDDILQCLQKASDSLSQVLSLSNALTHYVHNSLPAVAGKIAASAREGILSHVFLLPVYPEEKAKIVYSFGKKMPDARYRHMIERIGESELTDDKVSIILDTVESLADLEDALIGAELNAEEIDAVLHELRWPELAALSKKYMLTSDEEAITFSDQESLLRECLMDYIDNLPSNERKLIEKAGQELENNLETDVNPFA
jgi:hypothetical protein